MAATIQVTRPKGKGWRRDMLRRYKLFVDGLKTASVKEGETVSVEIEPGLHAIRAAIDWGSSSEVVFTLRPDETARFLVRPSDTPTRSYLHRFRDVAWSDYLTLERL